jgi:hypothetical protein
MYERVAFVKIIFVKSKKSKIEGRSVFFNILLRT